MPSTRTMTSTHWGPYEVEVEDGRVTALHPWEKDPNPSPIGTGMPEAIHHPGRITRPMIRKAWLDNGPGTPGRGEGPYVAVSWDRALDLAAQELKRVSDDYGNESIYAGSYGWASAGRFHLAQNQLHRFLNGMGGFTRSVNTYSLAAAEVIVPHVTGMSFIETQDFGTSLPIVAEHSEMVVGFGGWAPKNAQVAGGGFGRHNFEASIRACKDRGVDFVNISPLKGDDGGWLEAEWHQPRPSTDVALMMGLAHTLISEGLHGQDFLDNCTVGFDQFHAYLMGETDGLAKDAAWAADISGIAAETIRDLARRMAAKRTLITASWSLQRTDHGEQAYWMTMTLAAILGQIGLPGGGFAFGYGAVNSSGQPTIQLPRPSLPRGENEIDTYIPVARITDLLLNPGETIDYNGRRLTFPDVKIVYWCGGNPFHHHQDLNRMRQAWQRPDTVITHEPWWNPLARHADIVFPLATTLERNDLGSGRTDTFLIAMQQAIAPVGESRTDYETFSGLAERLGFADAFTEGRNETEWLRHLYDRYRQLMAERKIEAPSFDDFWEAGHFEPPVKAEPMVLMEAFRNDPAGKPLGTPSGKLEIFSETIAGYDYDDCPGHPTWMEPAEWLGAARATEYPLHMISNQPASRLHSQFDNGGESQASKIAGREPVLINTQDAATREITGGDLVRVYNDRGSCLAGAELSDDIAPGVIRLSTGAWYDPQDAGDPNSLEVHGNPNVLTLDKGTSKLAQGPIAQTALVEVERYDGTPPPVRAFTPPKIIEE